MTDHPVIAFVHGAETNRREVWGNGDSPDGLGAYSTVLHLVIKTSDLTNVDLTRPIMIHQESPND